jgi:hypothetical protein
VFFGFVANTLSPDFVPSAAAVIYRASGNAAGALVMRLAVIGLARVARHSTRHAFARARLSATERGGGLQPAARCHTMRFRPSGGLRSA